MVYVDLSCLMFADSEEELQTMADQLPSLNGARRKNRFHTHLAYPGVDVPFYRLTMRQALDALRLGAEKGKRLDILRSLGFDC